MTPHVRIPILMLATMTLIACESSVTQPPRDHPLEGAPGWIYHVRLVEGGREVWRVRPDRTDPERVVSGESGDVRSFDVTEDGRKIAASFADPDTGLHDRTVVFDLENGSETEFDLPAGARDMLEPRWSPDGTRLLVRVVDDVASSFEHLMVIEPGGSATRVTPSILTGALRGSWAPDGSAIATFLTDGDGLPHPAVIELGPGGPSTTVIGAFETVQSPSWHPDGEWITAVAFTDTLTDGARSGSAVYELGRNGDEARLLTEATPGRIELARPRYTPDGTAVVFLGVTPGEDFDAFVVDRAGGEPDVVADGRSTVLGLELSPDGAYVVYESEGAMWVGLADGSFAETTAAPASGPFVWLTLDG